jgi:hypothetical protein
MCGGNNVTEPHHFDTVPSLGENFGAAPAKSRSIKH